MSETVCLDHIVDPVLRAHVAHEMLETACSFCSRKGDEPFAVPMNCVADEVFKVVTWLYAEYDPYSYPYDDFAYNLETSEVVSDSSDGAFEDSVSYEVQEALVAAIATPESWASRGLQSQFQYDWSEFERTIRLESRFVYVANSYRPGSQREAPARLMHFLDGLLGYAEASADMVVSLPAKSRLYRARMTDKPEALRSRAMVEPSSELGSAPSNLAESGRMNAQGISLFYAAFDVSTAVAEVALHSRYDDAIAGMFQTVEALNVLDLTRKPSLPSAFDHAHRDRFMFVRFVEHFVANITAPVILDGRERIDYVPTQVVTEYLRWAPSTALDGIVFPSRANPDGKNIVLFFGAGHAFQTVPPTETEVQVARYSGGVDRSPALTISQADISRHSVRRHVTVENRDIPPRPVVE
jgi:hypothetical protein